MGLLDRMIVSSLQASTPSPDADFWYQPVSPITAAGIRIDAEGAQKISAWYRGRDLLATSLAMLPLQLFERLPEDEGAEVADEQPLYDLLHRKPNGWQDSFGWRRAHMYHLIDHGNAYDRIVAGPRSFVTELHPIPPTLVTPEQVNSKRILYHVRDAKTGRTETLTQDEVFHLRGASVDGVVGKGVLEYARDSLGTAGATESYAAKIYTAGTLNGGIISVPALLNDEASKRMARSFVTKVGEWHLPKVLEQGATWTDNTLTPEKAQMLLSRQFSINDIARWLGVPPHMLADLERSTNNNIEHQGQEFVTYSLGPWLSLWEFAINDQLVLKVQRFFAEFKRDALVRGDIAARWAAYTQAVTTGTFTRNEIRRIENKNKLPGLDKPLDPAHLTGKPPASGKTPEKEKASRAEAIATASAARVLRKEVTAIQKAAVRFAASEDEFVAFVTQFYTDHAQLVADTLQMTADQAQQYCWGQAQQIVNGAGWVASLDLWKTDGYASGLAALALEEAA